VSHFIYCYAECRYAECRGPILTPEQEVTLVNWRGIFKTLLIRISFFGLYLLTLFKKSDCKSILTFRQGRLTKGDKGSVRLASSLR
jgi:hypothetical protein